MQEQFRTQIDQAKKSAEIDLKRYEIDQKIALEREKMNIELQKAEAADIRGVVSQMQAAE